MRIVARDKGACEEQRTCETPRTTIVQALGELPEVGAATGPGPVSSIDRGAVVAHAQRNQNLRCKIRREYKPWLRISRRHIGPGQVRRPSAHFSVGYRPWRSVSFGPQGR